MEKFITHTGIDVLLRRFDVDTGQIVPTVYLKHVTHAGFENALLATWHSDPKFVLSRDTYKSGPVLVVGPDLGADFSREYAVWALKDYGFRVILAPKSVDIFHGNSGKQDLIIGIISQEDCVPLRKLLEAGPDTKVTTPLGDKTRRAGAIPGTFQIDDCVCQTLMESLGDTTLTLRREGEIVAYKIVRPSFKPRMLLAKFLPREGVVSTRD